MGVDLKKIYFPMISAGYGAIPLRAVLWDRHDSEKLTGKLAQERVARFVD